MSKLLVGNLNHRYYINLGIELTHHHAYREARDLLKESFKRLRRQKCEKEIDDLTLKKGMVLNCTGVCYLELRENNF